jgi:2-dehydropantoate 2-reductase
VITVFGAGAIGLTLAARLARGGHAVRLCARRSDDAALLAREGIHVEEPETGAAWHAVVQAHAGAPISETDPVFACVRSPQADAAAAAIAATSPGAPIVNVQNGVDGDARFAARFASVIGAVIRQGCTRVAANRVRAMQGGRIAVGRFPEGADAGVEAVAALLRSAGYDVGVSSRIAEDRWLKLCVNLMSTPNALVRPSEHGTRAFTAGKVRLLEEARDVLRAAGIAARSCDGRDRSLEQEIEQQRTALARGGGARRIPIYNSLWQALRLGAPIEADAYHATLIELGRRHGVATPTNERALAAVLRVVAESLGPEGLGAEEVLGAAS